jgi:hypothetical protein
MSYIPIFTKTGTTISTSDLINLNNNLIISGNTYTEVVNLVVNDYNKYNVPSSATYFVVPSRLNGMKLTDIKYNYHKYESIYDNNALIDYRVLVRDNFYNDGKS